MTRAQLLMLAAELIDDAPELGAALEDGAMTPADFEGLLSRGLVYRDGVLTDEGRIVLILIVTARGDRVNS